MASGQPRYGLPATLAPRFGVHYAWIVLGLTFAVMLAAAGLCQGVLLEGESLFLGGNPGIANQHVPIDLKPRTANSA